jgi:HPt (histidine-containing phosphotransfer) domain-containing protein
LRTALGDEELLRDLAREFRDHAMRDLAATRTALTQGRPGEAVRLAHRMAGGASEFRATRAVAACRELEQLAQAGDTAAALAALEVAAVRLQEVCRALEGQLPAELNSRR